MNKARVLDNEYGLAELQENLLQVLDVFDAICRQNNISYSLLGGALLGAERNHHLIPWDDDVDVSMWRDEFEKLKKVIENAGVPEGYYLDETTMWFPRLVMKNQSDPVYVDILIWDYISENRFSQMMKITLLRALQGMLKENVDYSQYDMKGKLLVGTTQIMGKLLSRKKKLALFHTVQTKMFCGKRRLVHKSNDSYVFCAQILDRGFMDGYTEIELEGKNYMAIERYRDFLRIDFGENYLTPPPVEERRPGHEKFRKAIEEKQKAANM